MLITLLTALALLSVSLAKTPAFSTALVPLDLGTTMITGLSTSTVGPTAGTISHNVIIVHKRICRGRLAVAGVNLL